MRANIDDFFKLDSNQIKAEMKKLDAEVLISAKLSKSLEETVSNYKEKLSYEVRSSYEKFQKNAKNLLNYWYAYYIKNENERITLSEYLSSLRSKINSLSIDLYELELSIYETFKKQKNEIYESMISSIHSSFNWEYLAKKNDKYLERIKNEVLSNYFPTFSQEDRFNDIY
ncbi:MAG: hypothetical protein QXR30_02910 [Candidatus Woesearchaeota archaeon]